MTHLIERVGSVGVGGEDVGHRLGTDLALGRSEHVVLKIGHAAVAGALNRDALFLADGRVELVDERVERFELFTVVVRPDRDIDRVRRGKSGVCLAAAACEQHHRRRCGEHAREKFVVSHDASFLFCAPFRNVQMSWRSRISVMARTCRMCVPDSKLRDSTTWLRMLMMALCVFSHS